MYVDDNTYDKIILAGENLAKAMKRYSNICRFATVEAVVIVILLLSIVRMWYIGCPK